MNGESWILYIQYLENYIEETVLRIGNHLASIA